MAEAARIAHLPPGLQTRILRTVPTFAALMLMAGCPHGWKPQTAPVAEVIAARDGAAACA